MKLTHHPYAQCNVSIYDNGSIKLTSYNTDIIYIENVSDPATRNFYITGLYSATTRKHISWFLKEFFPDISYQDIKNMPFHQVVYF